MVPFRLKDSPFFYGRDTEIRFLIQHLRHQRYFFVIGPSGSGKSSLVFAGLLPELQESRLFPAGFWLIRDMRPGAQPLQALAQALGGDPARADESIIGLLGAYQPAQRLLLVIDQFEELFTQVERTEQTQFVAALRTLRGQENCVLILTMRADFYPDLMQSDLWPVEAVERLEIAPLRGSALRQAIEQPALEVGVRLEPGLLERLMDDAASEPGLLPLIQETMRLLWSDMQDEVLTLSAYQALGSENSSGLAVAIATQADATLAALTPAQRQIARRIFLSLVQLNESGPDTRRQEALEGLHSASEDPHDFMVTIERLTRDRLLTRSGGENGHGPLVDLAHETLISGWPQLRRWLESDRAALIVHHRLMGVVREWSAQKHDLSFLYGGARLADAQEYAKRHAEDMSEDEKAFLAASVARDRMRERSRYLGQAAGGALGAALGFGLGFALMFAATGAPAFTTILMFLAMFPVGAMVGFGIGIALWLARGQPALRGAATAAFGALASGMAYPFFLISAIGRVEPQHVIAGVCIGAGLGLGAGLPHRPWHRLAGISLGGVISIGLAYMTGGVLGNVWMALFAGVALGGLTGLGFQMTAVEGGERLLG